MRRCLAFIFVLAAALSTRGAAKPWIEVRTEHFRVISDGDPESARAIAREFEQMRAIFAMGAQNMRLDSGAPLTIYAPRSAFSMGQLVANPGIAGQFHSGWERQFAVVRIDQDIPGRFTPVYHEYIHSLLHINFRWLPLWLDEGLAELYGSSEFKDKNALVGVPNERRFVLEDRNLDYEHAKLIPLRKLFAITSRSPDYQGGMKMQVFYAESWALTHYLVFNEGAEHGRKFVDFYNLLQSGIGQEKAFEQVFGPIDDVDRNLQKYATKGRMRAWEVSSPPQIFARDFAVRALSPAEMSAASGTFHLWAQYDLSGAQADLLQALTLDPNLPEAHENLGFLDFDKGKDQEAAREFAAALQLDPSRYLSLYYQTMLSPQAHSDSPADQAQFEKGLAHTLQLNPEFAPAYVQAAILYARKGQLKRALAAAHKATELEPARAGYSLLEGNLLLESGRIEEAAAISKYVADRWQGPDRDEALELWHKLPEDRRPALASQSDPDNPAEPAQKEHADDVKEASGTVSSVACDVDGKKTTLNLTLISNGQSSSYRNSGHVMQIGFSDSLWYGKDHFVLCQHIQGLRAIVRYKPNSDPKVPAELQAVEIRLDLPSPPSKANPVP